MCNAFNFLNESDRNRVESAIVEAEKATGAEIVCAIATESGRYDRAESLGGLAGALIGLAAAHGITAAGSATGSWHVAPASLLVLSLGVVIGFVVGCVGTSYAFTLRRLLCSRGELEAEAERGAAQVFLARGLSATSNRGAVLIYLSLFERRIVVLADEGARKAAGPDLVAKVRDVAQAELRAGRRAEALLGALKPIAESLAAKIPAPADNRNELPDALVVIHPRP